jgi:AsmA protein
VSRLLTPLKILLLALAAIVALCGVALLAVLHFVKIDDYRGAVQQAASGALGMEVTIEGPMKIGFNHGLHVALSAVRVRNRNTELASIQEADIELGLLPLLHRELRYGDIALDHAHFAIQRARDGHYNYEKPPAARGVPHALDLQRVKFRELQVTYSDEESGHTLDFQHCNGELNGLHHPGGAPFLMRLSATAQLACGDLQGELIATGLGFRLSATDGVFDFKPVTLQMYGGQGAGELHMNRSIAAPTLAIQYTLKQFRIQDFFDTHASGKTLSGLMDFSANVQLQGLTRGELRRSAAGELSLSGADLTLNGADLDAEFSKYESSQNFSLFDAGAVLLAGPLGLAVTKGYDFSTLALQKGGSTPLRTVKSTWKMTDGVAQAVDVAMATKQNRLAFQGGLDFVNDSFAMATVALIDSNGCAILRQAISGPFRKPVVEKPSVLKSLAGPLTSLFSKAKGLIPGVGGKCEPFYTGSVPQPGAPG